MDDTPRVDKLFDMVSEREGPTGTGRAPSRWSYEAILDLTDFARKLERELAAAKSEISRPDRERRGGIAMSYTPGPWSVNVRQIVAENGFVVASVKGPHPTAKGKEWHEDNQFCEGNASLIAAAPDLLGALLVCEAVLRIKGYEDAANAARAAITKARGQG